MNQNDAGIKRQIMGLLPSIPRLARGHGGLGVACRTCKPGDGGKGHFQNKEAAARQFVYVPS